jgi:4-nitrophenyl phosphatase
MTFDGAVVDLDGTVYRGDSLLPGAAEGVAALRAAGVDVLFFSNNPTRTPADYADTLDGFGIPVDPENVVTSGVVTREYLRAHHQNATVYVVGEPGLKQQLDAVDLTDDPESAEVLVGSIDRELTFDELEAALHTVRTGVSAFVGTDPDRVVPTGPGDDDVIPGSGAVVGAIAAAVDRDPDPILGKPSEEAVELALERLRVPPDRCVVVGDRLNTDIALGARAGMTTALVRTGMHDDDDIADDLPTPDHVLDSLGAVPDLL